MNSELITSLADIARLAAAHHDEFEVMRYMLQLDDDISDEKLDRLVDELAASVVAAIDCTQCANCCRHLEVGVTPQDIHRLSQGIHIPPEDIIARYVDVASAASDNEWGKFRQRPCPFLKGKLCLIYPHRPDSCRHYPQFTPDFRWILADLIEGAAFCPIIYNVLRTVSARVEDIIKNP